MNQRIDQLWAQALDAAVPETYTRLSHSQVLKIKQVFAELIVRECAKVAKKEQAFNARYTDADKHPQVNIDQCILIELGL